MENKNNINIRTHRKNRPTLNQIKPNASNTELPSMGLDAKKSKFKLVEDAVRMKKYADFESKENCKLEKYNRLSMKNLAPLNYNAVINYSKPSLIPVPSMAKTDQCIPISVNQPNPSKKSIENELESMWACNEYAHSSEEDEKLRATLQQFHCQIMSSRAKTDTNSITIHLTE